MRRRLAALAHTLLLLAALLLAPVGADDFNVYLSTTKPLGLKLDPSHVVLGFHRDASSGAKMPAEASGWVRPGDRLLAVNEQPVSGLTLAQVQRLVASADLPKVLRFRAPEGSNRSAEMRAAEASGGPAGFLGHEGTLEFAKAGVPLGAVDFMQALFGGPIRCTQAPLYRPTPAHGCSAYRPSSGGVGTGSANNAIVVVDRGVCPFQDKAALAQAAGAVGIVVINGEGGASAGGSKRRSSETFRMPADRGRRESDASELTLGVVMISEAAGAELLETMEGGGKRGLLGRLAVRHQRCKPWRGLADVTSASGGSSGGGEEAEEGEGEDSSSGGAGVSAPSSSPAPRGVLGDPLARGGALALYFRDAGEVAVEEAARRAAAAASAGGSKSGRGGAGARRSSSAGGVTPADAAAAAAAVAPNGLPRGLAPSSGLFVDGSGGVEASEQAVAAATGVDVARAKELAAAALSAAAGAGHAAAAAAAAHAARGRDGGVGTSGIRWSTFAASAAAKHAASAFAPEVTLESGETEGQSEGGGEGGEGGLDFSGNEPRDAAPVQPLTTLGGPLAARHLDASAPDTDVALSWATVLRGADVRVECLRGLVPPSGEALTPLTAPQVTPVSGNGGSSANLLAYAPLRLIAAVPPDGCSALSLPAEATWGAAVLVARGGCSFDEKRRNAASAGAALLVVANNEPGLIVMKGSPELRLPSLPAFLPSDAPAGGGGGSSGPPLVADLPAVLVSEAGGAALTAALARAAALSEAGTPTVPVLYPVGDDTTAAQWEELSGLADPSAWAGDAKARRKAYLRLSRLHHPDREGGAAERFDWLVAAYERAEKHWAAAGASAGAEATAASSPSAAAAPASASPSPSAAAPSNSGKVGGGSKGRVAEAASPSSSPSPPAATAGKAKQSASASSSSSTVPSPSSPSSSPSSPPSPSGAEAKKKGGVTAAELAAEAARQARARMEKAREEAKRGKRDL